MKSNDNRYRCIRLSVDLLPFFEVFHKSCGRKNKQEDIIAHHGDRQIGQRQRPRFEKERAVLGVCSYYFFYYSETGIRSQLIPINMHLPENMLGRLYKKISVPIDTAMMGTSSPNRIRSRSFEQLYSA